MPIYDYHCDACGHSFSQVQSYTDATLDICPQCGARPRKLMSRPAIVFKGSGWYKTDSRAGSAAAKADARAEGASEPVTATAAAKPGDAKSESKAEKASDPKSESGSQKAEAAPKAKVAAESKSKE